MERHEAREHSRGPTMTVEFTLESMESDYRQAEGYHLCSLERCSGCSLGVELGRKQSAGRSQVLGKEG